MPQNGNNNALQMQLVAQWITSLAISVICCAILFIVFAGYIVDLHDEVNLLNVKIEVMQERHNQLQSEVAFLKRSPLAQQPTGAAAPQSQMIPENTPNGAPPAAPAEVGVAPQPQQVPPSSDGVKINDQPGAGEPAAAPKEDVVMPTLSTDQIGNAMAKPKDSDKTKQPKK